MSNVIGYKDNASIRRAQWGAMREYRANALHFSNSTDEWNQRVAKRDTERFNIHLAAYVSG